MGSTARIRDAGVDHSRATGLTCIGPLSVRPTRPWGWPGDTRARHRTGSRQASRPRPDPPARYVVELSVAVSDGRIDLRRVSRLDDGSARDTLMAIPGIGPWTANIYLLMALRRRGVWPLADLALRNAARDLRELPDAPSDDGLEEYTKSWRPYGLVAARILWHYYLSSPRGQ